ncbi:hypothetical protein [Paenibacillus piri]|uniref:WYL domain-containing protein n=1 Tax=Paenibacillus piri TaxID=2547395 RepID=A0A4R5KER7_9BACL|nr:hypothetical protein [Paenibacillus piri]TDF93753.1 hypothetical protein E1757_25485 [Paenibacillus piri]
MAAYYVNGQIEDQTVEIIYLGTGGRITQRRIKIRQIRDGVAKAYCWQRKAPRTFKIENILAVQSMGGVQSA